MSEPTPFQVGDIVTHPDFDVELEVLATDGIEAALRERTDMGYLRLVELRNLTLVERPEVKDAMDVEVDEDILNEAAMPPIGLRQIKTAFVGGPKRQQFVARLVEFDGSEFSPVRYGDLLRRNRPDEDLEPVTWSASTPEQALWGVEDIVIDAERKASREGLREASGFTKTLGVAS